jgi:hypothetical protein
MKCCARAALLFLKATRPPSSTPPVTHAPARWGGAREGLAPAAALHLRALYSTTHQLWNMMLPIRQS